MIKTKGVLHVTIPVSDLARGRAFYTEILGLEFVAQAPKENPHFVFLKSGADYVLLARETSRGRFSDIIHHAFMVDGDRARSHSSHQSGKGVRARLDAGRLKRTGLLSACESETPAPRPRARSIPSYLRSPATDWECR